MSQPNTDKMNSLKPVSLPLSKIMKKQSNNSKDFNSVIDNLEISEIIKLNL